MHSLVNDITANLPPYAMEELAKIRTNLIERKVSVYDFGTGDPKIPLWPKLNEVLKASLTPTCNYPGAKGSPELSDSIHGYLKRRFGIEKSAGLDAISTRGSKEAVFHVAQSLVGRAGKKTIIYPNPGYPVYRSSILFAHGTPYPVTLKESDNYLLKPWELPEAIQQDAAAIWVNYPHNPTGAVADENYWRQLIDWGKKLNCLILSDDCYVDIYDVNIDKKLAQDDQRPLCPLMFATEGVVSFFSLSKRSGFTGYRCGFMAGDAQFLQQHLRARANMGIGTPMILQKTAAAAWDDDGHVAERRKIFSERLDYTYSKLIEMGFQGEKPKAAFYLWMKLPQPFTDDIDFCLKLAETGVITSPSQWLSDGIKGYFRMALVPDIKDTKTALELLKEFLHAYKRK